MSKILVAILVSVLFSIFGCKKSESSKEAPVEINMNPLQAAFDEKELGKPLDWNTLSGSDKAFLSALEDKDAAKAKAALAAGAKADLDCGHGCTALMLAAATGDAELVAAVKKAGVKATPDAEPYLEILNFAENAKRPEFKAALDEIEKLSGRKPAPGERAGLYKLELNQEAAKAFLQEHHARLLKNGCFVFQYERSFGIGGKPDELWILPTKDKFAVMAFTGVDGINYEIDNFLVIRWMKRLDRDHPFLLTGCGRDFLEGRFTEKLTDAAALAKKMYAFCPDIVDQGTESVDALAEEIQKVNGFFFWWD
jgi:hypothetical protein